MTALTPTRRQEIEELRSRVTPGPWRSMRDGNQYINVEMDPRKGKNTIFPAGRGQLVGASRIAGLPRPWNPWWVGDSCSPETQETTRLRDEDADFIAAAPQMVDDLLASDKTKDEVIAGLRAQIAHLNDRLRISNGIIEGVTR